MNPLKQVVLALTLAAGVAMPVLAQQVPATPSSQAAVGGVAETIDGEVRKVDKSAGKITLKHGEIRALEMPQMTMVFRVGDAAMLDKVKAGDKVRFTADKVNGAFTVTSIELAQ